MEKKLLEPFNHKNKMSVEEITDEFGITHNDIVFVFVDLESNK